MEYTVPCITSQLIEGEVRESPSVPRGSTRTLLSGAQGASDMPWFESFSADFVVPLHRASTVTPPRNLWNCRAGQQTLPGNVFPIVGRGPATGWYRVFLAGRSFGGAIAFRCYVRFLCLRLGQLEVSLNENRFLRTVSAGKSPV